MRHAARASTCTLIVALTMASVAFAQPPAGNAWRFGTTLGVFGGIATPAETARSLAGVSLGWEVTPRLAVEGTGTWLDGRHGADGFAATISARGSLMGSRRASPFLDAGFGLYRATFEGALDRASGFYRRRMAEDGGVRASFTDPAFALGGGMQWFVGRHLAVQPRVEALFIRGGGDTHAVTTFAVGLAYHFEDHWVTP